MENEPLNERGEMEQPQPKKARRKYGSGWIEFKNGKYWPRVRVGGKSPRLGSFPSEPEAEEALDAYNQLAADGGEVITSGVTLTQCGQAYLKRARVRGMRSINDAEGLFRLYVENDPIGNIPIDKFCLEDADQWLDRMLTRTVSYRPKKNGKPHARNGEVLSESRIQNALNGINVILNSAIEKGIIRYNPFAYIHVPMRADGEDVTEDKWHYLEMPLQKRLVEMEWPEPYKMYLVLFALFTGLRQGEVYNLKIEDVHLDDERPWIKVRYGSAGAPLKQVRNGRKRKRRSNVRVLFLFPIAARLLREWLGTMPAKMRKSKLGLVFPNINGRRRSKGEPSWWNAIKKLAGLPEDFVFHDLRHTCASSLIAGWWGRPWRLEEVQRYLDHSDIKVTERYADLAPSEVKKAVGETGMAALTGWKTPFNVQPAAAPAPTLPTPIAPQTPPSIVANYLSHLGDLNPRPTVYETGPLSIVSNGYGALGSNWGAISEAERKSMAQHLLIATATGDPAAGPLAEKLAGAMLLAEENELAHRTLTDGAHYLDHALTLAGKILGVVVARGAQSTMAAGPLGLGPKVG